MVFSIGSESCRGMFLYGLLFLLFMVLFGIPSVQKFQRQETIFISSRKLTNGIAAPAVTILALNNDTGYGWKSKTNTTSSASSRFKKTFLLDHCKEINQTFDTCVFKDTFKLTEILTSATFGGNAFSPNSLNISSWTMGVANTDNGRHYTWNLQRIISPAIADVIVISAQRVFKFFIYVHDINFFTLSANPLGPPKAYWEFNGNLMPSHYQELVLIKHQRLNLPHKPCMEDKTYSFTTCVKKGIAKKVGCQRPWDQKSQPYLPICMTKDQFALYDQLFFALNTNEIEEIERFTGCLRPCHYNEYKFVNSNPKDFIVIQVPDDQIAIGLWAVSKYTQFEEEVSSINQSTFYVNKKSEFCFMPGSSLPFHLPLG